MLNFSDSEIEYIYRLAEQLTGSLQSGNHRKDVIIANVGRRLSDRNCSSLLDYLKIVKNDPDEYSHFISALTIHTTFWFREEPHFEVLKDSINKMNTNRKNQLKIWSSACSTGEEVYSIALFLESIKREFKSQIDYFIYGSDIDPDSVNKANKAIYDVQAIESIPRKHHECLLIGSNITSGLFTLSPEIRKKTNFFCHNLVDHSIKIENESLDYIFCRNVLIYFETENAKKIVKHLLTKLNSGGILFLGHSENILGLNIGENVEPIGKGCFKKMDKENGAISRVSKKVNNKQVLVIDDSLIIRKKLSKILIENNFVVDECENAEDAHRKVAEKQYDLITLDLNLPGENGVSWLKTQRQKKLKCPIVIVSESSQQEAAKVFGALEGGAQDYIVKSRLNDSESEIIDLFKCLLEQYQNNNLLKTSPNRSSGKMIKAAPFTLVDFFPSVILIGASTGGPEALIKLLKDMPRNSPPIIVVQHINAAFSKAFADHLARASGLTLGGVDLLQANNLCEELQQGKIYLANCDYHLELITKSDNRNYLMANAKDIPVKGHRPSVDILFKSAAEKYNGQILSILLTGMGDDGAEGMLDLFTSKKSFTMAQNQESSVVYGMPKRALELGGVCWEDNLEGIRSKIFSFIRLQDKKVA